MSRMWIVAVLVALACPALALPKCDTFLQRLREGGGDMGVDYSRALVVSRARSNASHFDIFTNVNVDGTLVCRGERFVRFEVHALEPLRRSTEVGFGKLQQLAMRVALGVDEAKARSVSQDLGAEAREYLEASKQRGDVFIAGKTERHEPGGIGMGMIMTEIDRAFVIVAEE